MLSHPRKFAARTLLASLLLIAPGLAALAQSTTPPASSANSSTTTTAAASGKAAPKTTATPTSTTASSTADESPSSLLPSPAASQPVPLPVRAAAQATDASSSPHAPGDAPTVHEMHNIVVSAATRNEQAPNTTATDTTVVTQEDLEAQNYANVSDALREVPGVAVVPSGVPGQVTSVFIHGADSNMTLFTIDGRPQPGGLSGATDFTNLTLDNVAQIEVVKTPVSSVQGGGATGGVINLVSLNGRGLATPESSVSFEGGSFDTFTEKAQSRGSIGNFDYAVSASNEDSDMNRQNENYENTVYRGNFGYQATPDIYVDVHTGWSQADAGSPNVVETSDPVAHLLTADFFISPEVSAKVTDFYTTKVYYNHDQTRQTYHDLFTGAYFPTSTRLDLVTDSYDWQNNLQLARNWQITAGIQGSSQHANQVDDEDAGAEAAAFLSHGYINNTEDNIGTYAQSQWQPLTGLNVLSSIRYDGYSDYANALSWRQGVTYEIAPTKTVVHASGSSSYTPPPAQDLYYPGFNNPDLKPESALGWEAGVEQPFLDGKVTPSATYFHNDITNYILSLAPNFTPENVGKVTTQGVDLDVAAKPMDNLKLDVNYTYLTAENNTEDIRLVRRPRNSLNFSAIYTPIAPLTLSIGGSWVVGRQDIDPVSFAQEPAPDYFTLRASATYTINKNVTIWLRGENLTNEPYQPVLGYPALGIGGYGGVRVSF
jgi:vitamin B12 transporter